MQATIPSYEELLDATRGNMLLSSIHPKTLKRIEVFLDLVVSKVREGLKEQVVQVSNPFNFSADADIIDMVTKILLECGYNFSVNHYPSIGYQWEVELYYEYNRR